MFVAAIPNPAESATDGRGAPLAKETMSRDPAQGRENLAGDFHGAHQAKIKKMNNKINKK